MSDGILVVDNFLPPGLYENLRRFIATEPLMYGSRSNSETDTHGHWNKNFTSAGKNNLSDIAYVLEESSQFGSLSLAWKILRDAHLPGGILIRCYLNGYTYGTDGYFHTDSERATDRTSIVYVTDDWQPDWAGETVFLDAQGEIVKSVLPKKNRAVIFPSNIRHAARGVSRKCSVLRKALIFKTRKKGSESFERLSNFLIKNEATNYQHRNGTLHDHLVRTFAILESRGFKESVCFGGGLHSFYGTNRYSQSLMTPSSRSEIVAQFGAEAERLACLFSMLDRPGTLERPLELGMDTVIVEQRDKQELVISRGDFDALRNIECANLQDQNSLSEYKMLSKTWS
jgi:SM-20-related protein